jgi:hypothetical protein
VPPIVIIIEREQLIEEKIRKIEEKVSSTPSEKLPDNNPFPNDTLVEKPVKTPLNTSKPSLEEFIKNENGIYRIVV